MADPKGKRGSRKGKPNQTSAARERAVASSEPLPMAMMLRRARYHHTRVLNLLAKAPQIETDPHAIMAAPESKVDGVEITTTKAEIDRAFELACESASKTAPFVHPRLIRALTQRKPAPRFSWWAA